jgi:uncharacterized protein (TIGR02300 family)
MEAPFFRAQGAIVVAKPDLGIKRICGSCGAKFYDLARESIVCPKCGTSYEAAAVPARTQAAARPVPTPAPVAAVEEPELPQPAEVEVISLEDVDAEEKGKAKTAVPDAEAEAESDEEVEIATKEADDTFLEQEEEEPGDVSDIIGEKVEEDDET